jgi:DNA-binding response OmpR family regulator
VLVIEDDETARRLLEDYLTARGFEVVAATNGAEGLELARQRKPDVVLCDVLLPRKSGFEVCFELKRRGADPSPPVVLMSAILQGGADQRYAKEGVHADAYFVKPFPMSAMVSRIEQLLAAPA